MSLVSLATTIFLAVIFIGLLIGFFRSWKKSLFRSGILFVVLLLSIFISPVIASFVVDKFTDGSKIIIFSQTIDIENIVNDLFGDAKIGELFAEGSVSNELILSITNIIVNLAVFFVMFFVLQLLSYIIYFIVCICLKVKHKREAEAIEVEKNGKYWGLKVLSAFIGALGSVIICFAMFIPIFGVMNVCNGLVQEEKAKTEETASAFSSASYMAAGLYYTEDENIGKIESYIEKYAKLKKSYDKSFVGGFMKYTGLNKAGSAAFEKLTTVKQGGLKVNLTSEFVAITHTYNAYKDIFVRDKFDVTDNEDIDAIVALYDEAIESEIIKEYIVELIPKAVDKWSSGEKFLGFKSPFSGNWSETIEAALAVFKVNNINRISDNFKVIAQAIKVANLHGVIDDLQNKVQMKDILSNDDSIVKDEILVLTSTTELKENISIILNEAFEALYKEVVGEDKEFEDNRLTLSDIAEMNKNNQWKTEAEEIQNTVIKLFDVYNVIEKNSSSEILADQLEPIGFAIDSARNSKLISKPFQTFIFGFIENKVNISDDTGAKQELLDNIKNYWIDPEFSYATTFKTIQEAALVAKDILAGDKDVSLDSLAPVIKEVIKEQGSKDAVAGMLEKGLINEVVSDDDTAAVLTEVLTPLVSSNKVNNTTINNDIAAGEQLVEIVNNVRNNDGNLNLGETETERDAASDAIIANLIASEGMMDALAGSVESESGSAVVGFTKNVSTADRADLAKSINDANTSSANKQILKKLFGIA